MKLKNEFIMAGLDNEQVAVAAGENTSFHGLVKLNESGAEVFKGLTEGQNEEELAQRLMKKYEGLDKKTADQAVAIVIDKLKTAGLLEE